MAEKTVEDALRVRAAWALGCDHGILIRLNRRCSVESATIKKWLPEDLAAFQLGVKENVK